jgi:glutamyl-tRNA synthetase
LRALGVEPPVYAHVPMIHGADGGKLSKRHGAVSVLQYRDDGFLPEALLNYLVRLGWSHGDQEVFSLEQMQQLFDIADVNKAASAFDADKLLWFNQQHIKRASPQRLAQFLQPQLAALGIHCDDQHKLASVARAFQERARTLREMATTAVYFFREFEQYEDKAAKKNLTTEALAVLQAVRDALAGLEPWSSASIQQVIDGVAARLQLGMGKVAQPIRVAVSGTAVSPPIDITLEAMGRPMTLARLERALHYIAAAPAG